MLAHPVFNNTLRLRQCLAHWRASIGHRLEPNGKTDRLIDQPPCPVRDFFAALLDTSWRIADLADLYHLPPRQGARKRGRDLRAVTDHADFEIIANAFLFSAFDHEVLKKAVDGVRHTISFLLSALASAEGIGHRSRLIDEKNET